jgi:outer membrane protein TolC
LKHKATSAERLPSIVGFADYGTVGLSASNTVPTRRYGASIEIPLFDGGRRDARRAESRSVLKQEQIRTADLKDEIELKIRVALDAVDSADAQVQAAESGLALSTDELQQAERRYRAGVGTSIEVTDAQTRLQRGRENRISAIFNHALARIELAAAMGNIQGVVANWR